MIHFTLTGRYAGHTYCGSSKNETDNYMHIKGEETPIMQKLLHSSDSELCPHCKDVYNNTGEE